MTNTQRRFVPFHLAPASIQDERDAGYVIYEREATKLGRRVIVEDWYPISIGATCPAIYR